MKLFLFGGAEIDLPSRSVSVLKNLMKETLVKIKPESILHVPFARFHLVKEDRGEWSEGWFKEMMIDTGIAILDARNQSDINKANGSVIFVNGGSERRRLAEKVNRNKQLLKTILNAKYIVAESSGSMAMGEYMRADHNENGMIKGFGILKNVVIEPHYTERNYKNFLPEDMKKSGMRYGIGIDSATGIVIDPQEFPEKWEKIGAGSVYVKTIL
ncbi:MAG: hypothetical protein US40_C0017G0003 [Candidatus Roizmanbacteria bacterium GW2011_GWC2_37_13]|uniref:Peptidase E n=1 Tax=Candidatus Roizmanbacteria bacterium GW2011_GWC2_37_13 TaxID=1618486 RepID=A0A0G0G2T4_9BACT|nr:MAG: hypothetical protein US38_C0016G0003 [Candidatus Roizmanbacteria bacterium GW2011_GWC1_37_12]KKQ24307.1 MAG: hypothetical protein US40_C0017G0003 [Candidatus Roizmanbacteria bacterium GW2011_GWC2_37_13]